MISKIAHLMIHDSHHSQKAGEILIQPSSENPEVQLIIIIEIDSNKQEDYSFIEQFISHAYQALEEAHLAAGEKILEKVLHYLNENIPQFIPNPKRWLERLHCLVAVLTDGHLYFSAFGKIKIFLIKPTLIKDINTRTEEAENKIFSYTLSGEIKPEDKILLTTESLINYISLEKIKKTISTLPPKSAVAHLNNILQSTPPEVSFFFIVLQAGKKLIEIEESEKILPTKLSAPVTSKNSLDQLLTVEKETEKILTPPSFFESIRERIKKKTLVFSFSRKKFLEKIYLILPSPYKVKKFGELSKNKFKNILPYLSSPTKLKEGFKSLVVNISEKYKKLSKINKFLVIITVIILLLLTQNLIWQTRRQSLMKSEEKYQQLLGEIENKQNGIEASLIYNDTFRAKQLLTEIREILKELPTNTKKRQARNEEIIAKVQTFSEKVWKITNITEPSVLVDFVQLDPATQIQQIAINNQLLYAFGSTNQLFTVNLENKETKTFNDFELMLFNLRFWPRAKQIVGHTAEHKFYSLEENQSKEIPITLPADLKQIDDLDFYLDKMYILDKDSSQVYRFTQSSVGFVALKKWITDKTNINQGVSLAVDGYLYILLDNGQILRFASGKKTDFPEIIVEPTLTSATKIYTDTELNNIYLLDPTNKRFIILNKEGELIGQYYSDKFDNLKDIIIKEKEKKAYLLNGNNLFVVSIL
ncbi:hypothetical protein KKF32_01375 [Patescibacteria group bacterium]|nr:hypothetical protein [Patescibacteria group bacterium]